MTAGTWSAIAISCMALLFTVFSFWWMHWRPAKLSLGVIQFIAVGKATLGSTDNNLLVIGLPLILLNTGARTLVIEQLRLVATNEKWPGELDAVAEVQFNAEEPTLYLPSGSKDWKRDELALPTVLEPREIKRSNYVFEVLAPEFTFQAAIYRYQLQCKLSTSPNWRALREIVFDFREASPTDLYSLNHYYRVYRYPYKPWAV